MAKILIKIAFGIGALLLSAGVLASHPLIQLGPFQDKKEAASQQGRLHHLLPDLAVKLETSNTGHFVLIIHHLESAPQAFALSTELTHRGFDNHILNSDDTNDALGIKQDDIAVYRFAKLPAEEKALSDKSRDALKRAKNDANYAYLHDIKMPIATEETVAQTINLSLKEAIFLSLRYNPNIQSAELNRITERYLLKMAEQKFELNYALSGQYNLGSQKDSQGATITTKEMVIAPSLSTTTPLGTVLSSGISDYVSQTGANNPRWTISMTQPLLRGFGKTATMQSLNDALDNEVGRKISLSHNISNQISSVITTYRGLISQSNSLQTAKRSLSEAEETYQTNKKKIKAGQMAKTTNIQQAYQVESLKLSLSQAELAFIKAKKALLAIIGLSPKVRFAVPEDVMLEKLKVPDLDFSIQTALLNNAEYQTLKIQNRIHQRALAVAKNNQQWQLNLSADVSSGAGIGVDNGSNGFKNLSNFDNLTSNIALSLSIPINDLSLKSEWINAKLQIEQDKIQLAAARRALETAISNQIEEIKSTVSQYHLSQKQLSLAKRSYELEQKKQQAGISSSIELTNAQNQLISAENNLINLKIGYLNALTSLEQSMGSTLSRWGIQVLY